MGGLRLVVVELHGHHQPFILGVQVMSTVYSKPTMVVSTLSNQPGGIVDPVVLDAVYDPPLRGFTPAVGGNVDMTLVDPHTGVESRGVRPGCVAGGTYGGWIKTIHTAGTTAGGIVGWL